MPPVSVAAEMPRLIPFGRRGRGGLWPPSARSCWRPPGWPDTSFRVDVARVVGLVVEDLDAECFELLAKVPLLMQQLPRPDPRAVSVRVWYFSARFPGARYGPISGDCSAQGSLSAAGPRRRALCAHCCRERAGWCAALGTRVGRLVEDREGEDALGRVGAQDLHRRPFSGVRRCTRCPPSPQQPRSGSPRPPHTGPSPARSEWHRNPEPAGAVLRLGLWPMAPIRRSAGVERGGTLAGRRDRRR